MDDARAEAAADQFPCKQCGALLRFKPGTDAIACDYCGCQNPIAKRPWALIEEQELVRGLERLTETQPIEEKRVVKCKACAAEFTFDPHVHAASCPFCGSAVVAETHTVRVIQPAALVPFELDQRAAQGALKTWLGSLWLAPRDLVKYALTEGKLAGIYVPYWTYDADTFTDYEGERGDAYYIDEPYTTRDKDGNAVTQIRRRRYIRWTAVSGHVERFFDDVLVVASRSLPKKYADRLDSFRLASLQPYRPDYIAGFRSEVYQIDLKDGFVEAQRRIEDAIREEVRRDIGGDEQRVHGLRTDWQNLTFKHILLPIWLAAYRYGGKSYQFLVNGQTGEVEGARPYSWIKVGLAVLAGLIVLGAIVWLMQQS